MSPETACLGEVASFIRGITFKPGDVAPRGADGSVWCLRTKNVQAELDLSDVWAINASFVKRSEQYLQAGDLLVSSANSWNLIGKCSWVPELESDATFGGFVTVLRGNPNLVDRRYLYHWFSSSRTQAVVRSFSRQTTNIANLDLQRCSQLAIPLPSLAEQRRIAAVLEQVDALRAKRREAISLLDDLAQSVFLGMFGEPASNPMGWEQSTFGEVILGGPQNGLYKSAEDYGDGVPILRIDSFQAGELKPSSQWRLVNASLLEQERYGLRESDIVVNRVNSRSHLGKSVMVGEVPEGSVFESNMMRVRVDPSVVRPVFIERYLQSGFARRCILESAKDAVNQASINQQDVRALPVFVPSMRSQCDFEESLEQIRGGQRKHRAHLTALDELFTSLQHRAFSGILWDHEATGNVA